MSFFFKFLQQCCCRDIHRERKHVTLSGVILSRIRARDERGRTRESGRVGKIRDIENNASGDRLYMERRVHIYR